MYSHVAELFDLVYQKRTQDVDFYRAAVRQAISAEKTPRVLEIGAGTGRILLPIVKDNPQARFTALDIDDEELKILRGKIRQHGLRNVGIVNTDIRQFRAGKRFHVAIAPFRVLQHCLTPEALGDVFQGIYPMLEPGGKLIFDLFGPSIPLLSRTGRVTTQEFADDDGNLVVRKVDVHERSYFSQIQKIEERYEITYQGGRAQELSWTYETRYFFKGEVVPLLESAGLTVDQVLGGFDGAPFGQGGYPGELIFVTTKV